MRALVTGAGGFLGGAIARRLVQQGAEVVSFSRKPYPELAALGIEHHQGDLADGPSVARAAAGCDLVFHVAAKPGIWGRYADYYQTNVVGTENVLQACVKNRISRLIFTSSPSVVFDGNDMEGADESMPYPARYHAAYPETKAIAEKKVLEANGTDLATVALRPHLIWGPGDNHLVPRILTKGKAGQLRRIGRRSCLVDTTYIDHAADAHLLAAEKLEPGSPVAGRAYFISDGEPRPLWDIINDILAAGGLPPVEKTVSGSVAYLAGLVLEAAHRLFRLETEPRMTRFLARELSTAHWFDITAARRDLGYEPRVPYREGLRRLADWLQSEQEPPSPSFPPAE